MWVKRHVYEEKITKTAELQALVDSKQSQIERLQKEIDYWRDRFEQQLNRADRIHDNSMQREGMLPVSDLGLKEVRDRTVDYQKMLALAEKQTVEMFGDEIPEEKVKELGETGEFAADNELVQAVVSGLRG